MNLTLFCGAWHEYKALFLCQFPEQASFGLQDFCFIFFESVLYISHAVTQQSVEQLGQLTSQGDVGGQTANPAPQPSVETSQRFVDTISQRPCGSAKHPSSPIALSFDVSFTLAALFSAAGQAQPRNEVFLG